MRKVLNSWSFRVAALLIAASALTYYLHYFIFQDSHHIFIYMIGDMGFLFIDVLLVILFIERILARREKRIMLKKLNMVIGTFFSEVGLELLKRFSDFVENPEELEKDIRISPQWTPRQFQKAKASAENFPYKIRFDPKKMEELRSYLMSKHEFLLRLLENPNLLENQHFTDFLWAVFHLNEELSFRGEDLGGLPESDVAHLRTDMRRAYSQIVREWIGYTIHLKESYPFLFSLAARINPLNPSASPVVLG